jgi:hypothetical protein
VWLTDTERRTLSALCDLLIPADDSFPGAGAAGAPEFIDTLLGAFTFDPPRIWARPDAGFHRLGPLEELAWRTRIEGSQGIAEREFNGPVVGLQERYRSGLAGLGDDFADVPVDERRRRLPREFASLVYGHTCEAVYGSPAYGGSGAGWRAIGFEGPGPFTDDEVSGP